MNKKLRLTGRTLFLCAAMFPFLVAAEGKGCAADDDGDAAAQITPNVAGEWDLAWEDNLDVEIAIGGAVYEATIGPQGGAVEINHDGQPITFDLDCSRPAVVCPSEVWPANVTLDQRDEAFPRNVYVTIPTSTCAGAEVDPDPSECGENTNNVDCLPVCDGEVVVDSAEKFGRIAFSDDKLTVLLGAGIATNGVNCALLGLSIAETSLETTGAGPDGDWEAVSMPDGQVITGYAGGCLWAGDVNDDGTIEALVIGAAVSLQTGFTGARK